MKRIVAVLTLLVVSATVPAATVAGTTDGQAYAGSHVSFDTEQHAVVDYAVDGERTIDAVRVESQSGVESDLGLTGSVDLSAVAEMTGAAVATEAETDASASLSTDSGAAIDAHDNGHGSLVVTADEQSQYVALDLRDDAQVERESEDRVVFTTGSGTESTAMVVGDGNVTVTEDGNVTAALAEDSRLVVRSYADGRTAADETEERLIANGTAAASVYVMEQDGEAVTDTVTYGGDTTVEVRERAEGRLNMTVTRTEHEGRVVIAHVANETFSSADDVQVAVDGEAAASASSYAEVRQAANGGDTSRYMVRESGSAAASTDVVVGINHFSTRSVSMTDASAADADDDSSADEDTSDDSSTDDGSADDASDGDTSAGDSSDSDSSDGDSSASDGSDDDSSDSDANDVEGTSAGDGPGFGLAVTVLALVAVALVGARRR